MWDKFGRHHWSKQFFCERFFSDHSKGFFYSMYGCAVYKDKTFFCIWLIPRRFWGFFFMFWTSFASFTVLIVPLYQSSSSLCTIFDSISFNRKEVLLINLVHSVQVFGHRWPADGQLSYMDPWLWFFKSCSSEFLSFCWP